MLSTIVLGRRRSVLPISLRKGRKRKSIEDLPTELLIQIFLDCLSLKEFPRPWIREAPVLLTRVCQRWRSIALSSAQLWAAITLKRTRGRREEQDVMALDVWIQRSGSCPLSVYLRHGGDYYCTGKSVQTILPHVSRWKAVYLTASKHCMCVSQIDKVLPMHDKTPLLEDLRLYVAAPPPSLRREYIYPVPSLAAAPRLSSLHLGGVSFMHSIQPENTAFHAMRELRFQCGSAASCLLAIIRCPSLEILEIAMLKPRGDHVPEPTELYIMPQLHTLLVTGSLEHARPFVDHIRLPALLHLSIFSPHAKSGRESNIWPQINRLIMRSGGNLEGLRVDGHINGAEGVIEVLQGAHSLKSLSVGNSGSILTHMSILKPLLDISYVLCPQLDSFEFLGDWSHMDIRRVADILVYRWRHSRSYDERHSSPSMVMFELKECVYTFRHNIYISKCVDEGMRVAQLDCSQSWWLSRV